MAGVPVDMLVDISGPSDELISYSCAQPDDDPFELCSRQGKCSKIDLELELGLALEKSIKLHSQLGNNGTPGPETPVSSKADYEILVKLEDSPDKKATSDSTPQLNNRDSSDVFTHTAANPFELAWDVIEQEALTLANHIQHDKEKPISPRKMVDLAMKLSPDSLLLSPRNQARDEEILINSSPEQEMKKTSRHAQKPGNVRGRPSIGASPVISRSSYATPLRQRQSLAPQPSPLRKPAKPLIAPSPAKPVPNRTTFRAPLLRSSSATAPLNQMPAVKPPVTTKAVPLKAVHQPASTTHRAALRATTSETPVRRSITPSPRPSAGPIPGSAFQSKLRTPLSRSESEAIHQSATAKAASDPHKAASFSRYAIRKPVAAGSASNPSSSSSSSSRSSIAPRLKAKGRENIEP